MNFLADIYRHDRARVDELEARLLAQLPGAAAAAEGAAPDEAEVEVVVPAGAGGF
jgi:tripartite-type tricarboxylate transporter receptor subunit TctC